MKQNASLVIPLFNNEKTLVAQLKKCEQVMKRVCSNYEIIVCDDKSSDSSTFLLKKHFKKNSSFNLIFHKKNQGIAKTVLSLYKKAKYSYIVLFSVDGDWEPNDIEKLLIFAKKKNADIVIGKRKYIKYSFFRRVITFFYNFLPILFFQVKTIDAGSIKLIKNEIINETTLLSKSVFFEAEMIIRASKKGKKIVELPISFNKKSKKGLGGKMKLLILSIKDLINLRLNM